MLRLGTCGHILCCWILVQVIVASSLILSVCVCCGAVLRARCWIMLTVEAV